MEQIAYFVLRAFYFFMPAYFANMAPVFFKDIPFLNYPIDCNKKFMGKPMLGRNKTFRGLFFGILLAMAVAFIQYLLTIYPSFRALGFVDYSSWVLIGFLFGLGTIVGDFIESFFKRRLDVKPGKPFVPFDQLDYTVGGLVFISFIFVPSWQLVFVLLVMNIFLHLFVSRIGYYLNIRKVKM